MSESIPQKPLPDDSDESRLKIYFLPNLLTAGNLFCGFVALTKIVEANPDADNLSARFTSPSYSFCSRVFAICSTGAWRVGAVRKARSGANSIRWRT